MNAEQRKQAADLFGDALELPTDERAAFVQAASGDTPVQQEALRMLEDAARIDSNWLAPPADPETVTEGSTRSGGTAFVAGQTVAGRYLIERLINAGGMGEVYAARDEKLNQRIALKTILPRIARDPRMMDRFRREVAVARRVTHANVCRVFDFGEHREDGREVAFLTMEYVAGETLKERLKRTGPMTPEQALPLVRQMLDALGAAHAAGVVHRDFKPGNVMLSPSAEGGDRVVVTDFGLSLSVRREEAERTLTRSGAVVGTPQYMAPEQWTGGEFTPATDLYALGVVMYEMLAGKRPEWPRPAEASLDERWAQVIERCLEKDPGARLQSAAEVRRALDDLEPGSRRPRRVWALAAAAFLTLLLALFLSPFRLQNQPGTGGAGNRNVAVLPFRAGEPELQVFADGLMEAITQRLSQYEGINQSLLVAPASEMRSGEIASARDAKAKLGTDFAVEATLQSQDGRLRLVMAVIDTSAMRQVGSAIVEGTRAKALSLQDEAVAKLVGALDLRVLPAHVAEQPPTAPQAYDFYLSGRGYLRRNDQVASVRLAVEQFQRGVDADPKYALTRAGLSEAYWRLYERTNEAEFVDKAVEECGRALALNQNLAEVRISCGRVLAGTGKPEAALEHFQSALKLDPRNGEAFEGLGRAQEALGRIDLAESAFRDMVRLRSADWQAYKQLGLFFYRRERYPEAVEQYRRVVQLTPDSAQGYSNLGAALYGAGQFDEARRALEHSHQIQPRHSNLSNLGKLLFDQGKFAEAAGYQRRAAEERPLSFILWGNLAASYYWARDPRAPESYRRAISLAAKDLATNPKNTVIYGYLAHYYAYLGEHEKARTWLAQALRLPDKNPATLVRHASTMAALGELRQARLMLDEAFAAGYDPSVAARNLQLKRLIQKEAK